MYGFFSTLGLIVLHCCVRFVNLSNTTTDINTNLYQISEHKFSVFNTTNLTVIDLIEDLNTESSVRNYRQIGPWVKHANGPIRSRPDSKNDRNDLPNPIEYRG